MLLTDIVVKNLIKPGRYTDDQIKGLHLWVKSNGEKYWIKRYTLHAKRHGLGLGAYPEVSLRDARQRAMEARQAVMKGINPIEERRKGKRPLDTKPVPLFKDFALNHIESMRPMWRNAKHGDQWVSTVKSYAFPIIGNLTLDEVDTPHLLTILQPIWLVKPETASRLRGRLERIFSAAITLKLRPAVNPALWKGHLENLLPQQKSSDKHHAAMPFAKLPQFMARLREMDSLSALALEFAILNASRTSEVLKGLRSEVAGQIWNIPGSRMKSGKPHQIPLTQRSLEILSIAEKLDPESGYLFSRNGKAMSNMSMLMLVRRLSPNTTVHGFRSTFRDWVAEETLHSSEVAEMALAHTIPNKVERAYRRGNLLEQRKRLMNDWASYCLTGAWSNVVEIHQRKSA